MLAAYAAHGAQLGGAGLVLEQEFLGVLPGLDLLEDLAHFIARFLGDDARAAGEVAVFRIVRNRITHVGDAALVNQVDDQLEFMQAFEVRHFGRVPRFDQCLEAGLDQCGSAAAQHDLFAEQVGLGLFAEIGLDDAGLATADRRGVGQRQVARLLRRILVDCDQHRHAAALRERRAHGVARRLGRNHHHVEVGARHDLSEVDVESVRKGQCRAFLEAGLDLLVDGADILIRQQDHDEIGVLHGVGRLLHIEAGLLGLVPGSTALAQADRHLDAGILEVERMGMALRTVTENRDFLALDQTQVCVLVVKNFHVCLVC